MAAARLASVDAMRGITVAGMLLVNNPGDWSHVYAPLRHADWHGCTPTDLIFPFFLFVVGVSIALTLGPRIEGGGDRAALSRGVLVRAARLVALGLGLHLAAWWLLGGEHYRPWGVLQRIGLCFAAAGLLAIHVRAVGQWIVVAALLGAAWALLAAGGSYEPWENVASRLDTALFAPWLYQIDPVTGRGHDPEGLLSTLPAIATTLLGVRAGETLRRGRVGAIVAGALIALALGAAWSLVLPINKALWTPSYVAWTAGWAGLALAATHALVDRLGVPAWGRAFGVNAIAAYVGSALMVYVLAAAGLWSVLYETGFAGWMTPRFGPTLPSLAFALAFVAFWWGVVHIMDRRGWQLRV